MKALVFENGRLRLADDYPVPRPAAGEALVRVLLAGICATDLEIVKGYMGFAGIPGHEFVGVVEQADDPALAGQRVAGEINAACGACDLCAAGLARHCPGRTVLGIAGRDGAFAEYLALPERNLHPLPDTVTDEQAVFVEPLAAAFEIIEQVEVGDGSRVCVLGDGRLGLLAAQVLAARAPALLAVGRHPRNLALLERRGIRTALAPDRAARARNPGSGVEHAHDTGGGAGLPPFDLVVECSGSAAGLEAAMALVRPRGTIVLKSTIAGVRQLDLNRLVIDEITVTGSRCGPFAPAIEALASGRVDVRGMVDAEFALDKGAAAFARAAKPGALKVLLRIG